MLKIDIHAHYLPRDWPDLAKKYGDDRFPVIHHTDDGRHRIYKDGKFFREIWSNTWEPQQRIDEYARFGVQVQVSSPVPVMFSYWGKANQALELPQADRKDVCSSDLIDIHAHYLPRDWPDLAKKYGDDRFPVIHHTDDGRHRIYKDGKFFREIWSNTWEPQQRIDEYARFGVQVQVISTVPVMFSYWAKANQALELHQALNDHMAETLRAHPRHYAGIGTVPMQSPRLAVQELERCIAQLGLQGVQIGAHIGGWNLDAPELFPFFEAAADLGAAILVLPWELMGPESMTKARKRTRLHSRHSCATRLPSSSCQNTSCITK